MKTSICVASIAAICFAGPSFAQAPDPRPGPSTPVTVVNTPLPVTGTISGDVTATVTGDVNATLVGTPQVRIATDHVSFSKRLCIPDFCTPASPSSFTVPSSTAGGQTVKELVIEFVSARCSGTGRIGDVELRGELGTQTIAATGDNFSINYFPAAVDQYNSALGQNGVQSLAHQTHITYVPGTEVSTTYSIVQAGQNFCRVQLNGRFVTTP